MKAFLLFLMFPAVAAAAEIPLADCPPAVKATIEQNSRGGKIDDIDSHGIEGKTLYVAEVDLPGNLELKIHVGADGTLIKTREDIALADLPEAVKKTVDSKLSGGHADDAEKEITGETTVFHVEIDHTGAPDIDLMIDSSGKVISESEERED